MNDTVQQIKDRLPIEEVAGWYTRLELSGKHFKGKSPFVDERTPSFFVSPDKGLFHCFSSGKGGDIFSLVQELEKLDFKGALQFLAEKAGIELKKVNPQKARENKNMYACLEMANKVYQVNLRKDKQVVEYLLNRGLTKETMIKFQLGYAKEGWTELVDGLIRSGFPKSIIGTAGLSTAGKLGPVDRFRDRIMFPIRDAQGRTVAFTGRIFLRPHEKDNPPDHKVKTGKYVNSPETPLYHKSKLLYGFDMAKREMGRAGRCIVVEGQMDLIMCHQFGYTESVALSGTALTDDQLRQIARFTDTIIMALDGDRAGIEAVNKSVMNAMAHDLSVKVVTLETGKDPADILLQDPEIFQAAVIAAEDFLTFRIKTLVKDDIAQRKLLNHVKNDMYPYVETMRGDILRDQALQDIARIIGASIDAIRADFSKWQQGRSKNQPARNTHSPSKTSTAVIRPHEALFGIWLLLSSDKSKDEDLKSWQETWSEFWPALEQSMPVGFKVSIWQEALADRQDQLLMQTELLYAQLDLDKQIEAFHETLNRVRRQAGKQKLDLIRQKLSQAEALGKEDELLELAKENQDMISWLARLG